MISTSSIPTPSCPTIVHVPSRDFSAVIVCVGAGSRWEPAQGNGLAHLLEHAAFLGAGSRDYRSIRETIDELGGDVSAETGEEVILYWGSVNERRDFQRCLDLVADLVLAPTFEEECLRREIGTVVQEISGAGNDVFQEVFESTKRLLWPHHPLGRPVGGRERVLRRLDAAACRAYWRATHLPDRMLVLVVGSAAESKLARARFRARPAADRIFHLPGSVAGTPVIAAEPPTAREDGPAFRGIALGGRFARLCFGLPGIAWTDPRLPALLLLNDLLGRDETSRLWERVRGQGLSYGTESFADCFSDRGWVGVLTDAPVDGAGEVVRMICEEFGKLPNDLTAEELDRARTSHIARLRSDEQNAPLEWAKDQAVYGYFMGRVPMVEDLVSPLERVTLDQVRQVGRDLLRLNQLRLTAGGPRVALRDSAAAFAEAVR
ncbi:MAG: M16 family metallopeptidase [Chloroflexota bacterium]